MELVEKIKQSGVSVAEISKHTGVCKAYQQTKDVFGLMRHCRHRDITTTQIYLKSLGLIDNSVIRDASW